MILLGYHDYVALDKGILFSKFLNSTVNTNKFLDNKGLTC